MKKVKTLNIIAISLLVFEILSYFGSLNNEKNNIGSQAELVGYYFGLNLPIIISAVLFIIAYSKRMKIKQNREDDMIDSIGESE